MLATCETMPLCCISVFYLELHVTIEGLLLHSCLIGACCVACHPYDKVHMAKPRHAVQLGHGPWLVTSLCICSLKLNYGNMFC